MPSQIRVSINAQATLRAVGPIADRATYRAAQQLRSRAVANINSLGRVDTGLMKDSIRVRKAETSVLGAVAYTVGSKAPYTKFQEFGTRAHGPRRAKFMRFQIRGGGPWIFAKWVRGVTPGNFMKDAKNAVKISDFF